MFKIEYIDENGNQKTRDSTQEESNEINARKAAYSTSSKLEKNKEITSEILAIESKRQPRAMRDAILFNDKTRLEAINDEIAILRAKLK